MLKLLSKYVYFVLSCVLFFIALLTFSNQSFAAEKDSGATLSNSQYSNSVIQDNTTPSTVPEESDDNSFGSSLAPINPTTSVTSPSPVVAQTSNVNNTPTTISTTNSNPSNPAAVTINTAPVTSPVPVVTPASNASNTATNNTQNSTVNSANTVQNNSTTNIQVPVKIRHNSISDIEQRNYGYFQLGVGTDAFSQMFISLTQFNTDSNKYETSKYHLSGNFDINPTFILGFYMVNYSMAIEVEYGLNSVYEKKIDGKKTGSLSQDKAYIIMNYATINLKKNLFTFWGNNIFFVDGGLGIATVTLPTEGSGTDTKIEPVVQAGFGMYHHINQHIDLGLEYKYKTNIATNSTMPNGIQQTYWLQQHTIFVSVKFKI